jgi:hypothetical protein
MAWFLAALFVIGSVFAGETCSFDEVPKGNYLGISKVVSEPSAGLNEVVHQIEVVSANLLQVVKTFRVAKQCVRGVSVAEIHF